jgi:hypothetical protein
MNDSQRNKWNKVAVTNSKVLTQHLSGVTEEKHETSGSG